MWCRLPGASGEDDECHGAKALSRRCAWSCSLCSIQGSAANGSVARRPQVHAIVGVREASMGLAHPTRWDLVSDKQALQEEQALQASPALVLLGRLGGGVPAGGAVRLRPWGDASQQAGSARELAQHCPQRSSALFCRAVQFPLPLHPNPPTPSLHRLPPSSCCPNPTHAHPAPCHRWRAAPRC